jgi:hypothetical protein
LLDGTLAGVKLDPTEGVELGLDPVDGAAQITDCRLGRSEPSAMPGSGSLGSATTTSTSEMQVASPARTETVMRRGRRADTQPT